MGFAEWLTQSRSSLRDVFVGNLGRGVCFEDSMSEKYSFKNVRFVAFIKWDLYWQFDHNEKETTAKHTTI